MSFNTFLHFCRYICSLPQEAAQVVWLDETSSPRCAKYADIVGYRFARCYLRATQPPRKRQENQSFIIIVVREERARAQALLNS